MRSSSAYSIQVVALRLTVVSVFKLADKSLLYVINYLKKIGRRQRVDASAGCELLTNSL